MSELPNPEWRIPYQEAVKETDMQRLRDRLFTAENAICERLRAISGLGDHDEERLALADAIERLRTLEIEKLNYPDWIRNQSKSTLGSDRG